MMKLLSYINVFKYLKGFKNKKLGQIFSNIFSSILSFFAGIRATLYLRYFIQVKVKGVSYDVSEEGNTYRLKAQNGAEITISKKEVKDTLKVFLRNKESDLVPSVLFHDEMLKLDKLRFEKGTVLNIKSGKKVKDKYRMTQLYFINW